MGLTAMTIPAKSIRHICSLLFAAMLSGCPSLPVLDRPAAKTLASTGQAATTSLQQQARQVSNSLAALPLTVTLNEILNCRYAKPAVRQPCVKSAKANAQSKPFMKEQKDLLNLVNKRAEAFKALNQAYVAFGDLANYDAAKQAAGAVENAFGKINDCSKALATFGVPAIPQITASITKMFGGLAAAAADERQAKAVLAVSQDLRRAVDTMANVLKAEQDLAAMKSLVEELEQERMRLRSRTLEAGLTSPMSVLGSFYSKISPDVVLQTPPPGNIDLAIAGADEVLDQAVSTRPAMLAASYDHAVAALAAMSAEHQKFEQKKDLDPSLVLAEIQHLRETISNLK